jgi:hypothetical protein
VVPRGHYSQANNPFRAFRLSRKGLLRIAQCFRIGCLTEYPQKSRKGRLIRHSHAYCGYYSTRCFFSSARHALSRSFGTWSVLNTGHPKLKLWAFITCPAGTGEGDPRMDVETSTGRSHQSPMFCASGTGERQFRLTGPHPLLTTPRRASFDIIVLRRRPAADKKGAFFESGDSFANCLTQTKR